jgi:hypothetical protein
MTLRTLIVLLAILNLGVAAWWLLRPNAAPAAEDAPSGIARLQLISERSGPSPAPATLVAAATVPAAAATTAQALPTQPERCFSFGPFVDTQALAAAQTSLRTGTLRLHPRIASQDSGRGWRVFLPAAADRAAANATADKLKASGFSDLLIVADGTEANSIALGRFSGEARAKQHAGALRTAGFEAKAEPLGAVRSEGWLDIAVAADFDLTAALRASGAAQSRVIDCAGVR